MEGLFLSRADMHAVSHPIVSRPSRTARGCKSDAGRQKANPGRNKTPCSLQKPQLIKLPVDCKKTGR